MLKDFFKLGIIIKNNKPIAHRSLIKILINPFLRSLFSKAIASNVVDNKFIGYKLINQNGNFKFHFKPEFDYDYII